MNQKRKKQDRMDITSSEGERKKTINVVKTYPVPYELKEIKESIYIKRNTPSKEQIINQAIYLHSQGNIPEAAKYYQHFINQGFNDYRVFSNYAVILRSLGKLEEAEFIYRKAIQIKPDFAELHYNLGNVLRDLNKLQDAELSQLKAIQIKPDFAEAHYNLGIILSDLGKLDDSEISYCKAIEIKPDFAQAYYSLSLIKYSNENKILQDQLFSESILNNKSKKDQVNIYFARANVLHKEKNYEESYRYLKLANQLKLALQPSKANSLINQSKILLIESDTEKFNQTKLRKYPESIFIVGMPRSGSTLLESIISISNDVFDLGEINILEESYLESKDPKQDVNLAEVYRKKVNQKTKLNINTNKWLYNYQYAGIIAQHIPNAKIIHCYRNPLDNILSIYRTHFSTKNDYASSLVDCTRVYLDQEEIMSKYKKKFKSKIYDFNYDSLVRNPKQEIKSLISWLGWKWDDRYLTPHLNPRSVLTASNIQVRAPINSKSISGWKNYKEMLKPAIEILTQTDKYKCIIS